MLGIAAAAAAAPASLNVSLLFIAIMSPLRIVLLNSLHNIK
jgi:hypothetical protein